MNGMLVKWNTVRDYDLLDVLFVIETLTVGYMIYLLWGTI